MIKLKEPGERGGVMEVTMSPFDALSLQEGLTSGIIHLQHLLETEKGDLTQRMLTVKLKDARANYDELQKVLDTREEKLRG